MLTFKQGASGTDAWVQKSKERLQQKRKWRTIHVASGITGDDVVEQ